MDFEYDAIYHLKSIEQLVSEGAIYDAEKFALEHDDFYLWGSMLQMFDSDIYIDRFNDIYLAANGDFLAHNGSFESSVQFIKVFALNTCRNCSLSFGLFE